MAIAKHRYFPKGSWVKVVNPRSPHFERIGKVVMAGKLMSDIILENEDGTETRRSFPNASLCKHEVAPEIKKGDGVIVVADTSPYYLRRGLVDDLIAGNEIALVDFGGRFTDEAKKIHKSLIQIHTSDLSILEGASAGSLSGGDRLRSAQG